MGKNPVKVKILGISFSIQSDENPAHLENVVELLNLRIEKVKDEVSTTDPLKIALLAALNLVDELLRKQQDIDESAEIGSITGQLIKRIDECLIESDL